MLRRAAISIAAALSAVLMILGALPASAMAGDTGDMDPPQSVTKTSRNAALTLSTNQIGNVANPPQDVILTFDASVQPGDVYTITVPQSIKNDGNGAYQISDSGPIDASTGTVTRRADNANRTVVFTYRFTAVASISVDIHLRPTNNYHAQPNPIDGLGTWAKTIDWTYQGHELDPVPFTQVIKPAMAPKPIERVSPTSAEYKSIYVNQNYTYRFRVNQTDGVRDDTGYPAAQINSAVNYGTTIRVPVPKYFTLDQEATNTKNNFQDATTITQPGGPSSDLIITVPKGSGTQGWFGEPYFFIGSYRTEAPREETKLVADGPITIEQKTVDWQGQPHTETVEVPAWVEYLRGGDASEVCPNGANTCISVGIAGNNTGNNLLLTEDSKLTTLNFIGFRNGSPLPLTDAEITVKVPSGFDATGIHVPKNDVKLPGLSSYGYRITLLDGTTMIGTATAGSLISRSKNSPIREIVLYPNLLEVGAQTDIASSCTPFVDNNADCAGRTVLYLQGTLAQHYDDGTPVLIGDTLTTSVSIYSPSKTMIDSTTGEHKRFTVTAWNTQHVIGQDALRATIGVYANQNSQSPGKNEAGYLSLYVSNRADLGTTPYIHEPVFYYVLPQAATFNPQRGLEALNRHQDGTTATPSVSAFMADDGRQVVKVDYTGTGYDYYTQGAHTNEIWMDNNADAVTGNYPWQIYVVSPQTKLNTTANPAGPPAEPSWVQNHTDDVYLAGGGNWTITAPKEVRMTELSQGNASSAFAMSTISNDRRTLNGDTENYEDPTTMRFALTVINNDSRTLRNVREFVAIPKTLNETTFALNLSGPLTFLNINAPGQPVPDYTVLYSTQPVTFTRDQNSTPSTDGYVTADEVTDWSDVRSLVIEAPELPANTTLGRFILTAKDETLYKDAQKHVYLESGMYAQKPDGTNMMPLVIDGGSDRAASISVTGASTITARLHWKDDDGTDHYVPLPGLAKSYQNNKDLFPALGVDYPKTGKELSVEDQRLVPEGYELQDAEPSIIGDLAATYPGTGWSAGTAAFNTMTRYNYDGSIVQYELMRKRNLVSTMPVTGLDSFWNPVTLTLLTAGMLGFAFVMIVTRRDGTHRPSHTESGR